MARLATIFATAFITSTLLAAVGCGSSSDSEFGNNGNGGGDGNGGNGNGGGFGPGGGNGGNGGNGACVGLQCNQVACPGGGTTQLSGKVYDPSGTVPLYNAVVYVPNAKVEAFPEGITCDKCGTTPSGAPVTTAITDASGTFHLKNVPVGVDVPLVVQIGRWRRQVTIPAAGVGKCEDRPVDAGLTRLPRNKAEGDIPRIAISTGGADSLECFLRKIGIEDQEITNPSGTGRVHLYQGLRDKNDGARIDANTPSGESLWATTDPNTNAPAMNKYDMVILSCEGAENTGTKSQGAKSNLEQYLNAGGRVFASHFHYTWFKNGAGQLPMTAAWTSNGDVGNKAVAVDTTFAKGQAFSEWLTNVGASTTPGTMDMTELRRNVKAVPNANMSQDVSRRWLYTGTSGGADEETKFYSFNAPIGAGADQQCGRGVYTDIHVSSGDASGGTFPANCTTSGLTPQEKALLFLLFDLASCIQDDNKPPAAPPTQTVN